MALERVHAIEFRVRQLGMFILVGFDGRLKIAPRNVARRNPSVVKLCVAHHEELKQWLLTLAR